MPARVEIVETIQSSYNLPIVINNIMGLISANRNPRIERLHIYDSVWPTKGGMSCERGTVYEIVYSHDGDI